jgi:hypothetical protein
MSDKDNMMNVFKCHCNYHLGMGPNLQCPLHGTRENLHAGVVSRRAEKERSTIEHNTMQEAFNAAINFALDDANIGEGILFLELWREGDWQSIRDEFPEFKSSILHPKA